MTIRSSVLALLLAGATPVFAQGLPPPATTATPAPPTPPATVSGSTSTVVDWRGDNRNGDDTDDHFGTAIMRTQLGLDGGDTRAELRFDGEGFVNLPVGPAAPDRRSDLRLERARLDFDRELGTHGRLELALGDFYAQVGRGLLLSLRRVDELGLDVALRGARARVGLLDDRISLALLGGTTNAVNVERQRLARVDEPEDRIGAARVETRTGDLVLALHTVGSRESEEAPLGGADQSLGWGGGAEGTVGPVAFAVEVDRQHRRIAGQSLTGLGAYGTATATTGRVTLLAEGKHYDGFAALVSRRVIGGDGRLLLSLPPTAERLDQEVLDNTDITGGRLRADVVVSAETASSVHASLGVFRNRFFDQWFSHGFAGVDWRRESGLALLLAGGHRREWQTDGTPVREIAHAELDVLVPLGDRISMHLAAKHQTVTEGAAASRDVFHRGDSAVELSLAERWSLGGGLDWDTQKRAAGLAQAFPWAFVRWRPGDRLLVQLLGGAQRGGIRCIAGACREQPPFTGVRADVTVRF